MQALRGVEAALHAHGAANRPTGVAERGFYTSQGLHLSLTPRRTP